MFERTDGYDRGKWDKLIVEKSTFGYAKIRIISHDQSKGKHDDVEFLITDGGEYCPDFDDDLSKVLDELSSSGIKKDTIQLCHDPFGDQDV